MELHSNHSQFPPEDQLGPGMAQTFLGCLIPISVEVKGKNENQTNCLVLLGVSPKFAVLYWIQYVEDFLPTYTIGTKICIFWNFGTNFLKH